MVGTINQSESCTEVHAGVQRCAEVHMEVCTEVCAEVRGGVHGGVRGGVHGDTWRCTEIHGGARRGAQRSLATIDLVGDSREFEV